jgi:hypothetical protein
VKIVERVDKSVEIFLSSDWRFNLLKNWREILGPLHEHMRIERIENDFLIIGVYDAHWMQELYLLSKNLLKTINDSLEKNSIKRLNFKLVKKPSNLRFDLNLKQNFKQEKLQRNLTENENNALLKISDPQLKEAMKAFLLRKESEKYF